MTEPSPEEQAVTTTDWDPMPGGPTVGSEEMVGALPTPLNAEISPAIGTAAAAGAAWLTVEMIAVQAIALLVFAVLAHFLTPRSFGLVALAFAIVNSLRAVFLDPILVPVTKKASPSNLDYTTAFWITAIIGIAGTALLELTAFLLQRYLRDGLGEVMYAMAMLFLPIALGRAQEAWLFRASRFRILAIRSIAASVLGGCAGFGAAVAHLGVWSLVIQQVASSGLSFLFLWWTTPWRPTLQFSKDMASKIWALQKGLSLSSILNVLNQNSDTALVAIFFGPAAVGIYSVAKRLKLALQLVAGTPARASTLPILADLQDNPIRLREAFTGATQFITVISAPIFFGAAAVSHQAIAVLFGHEWSRAAPIFEWLSIGALAAVLSDFIAVMLQWRDKAGWQSGLSLLQTVLSLVLFYPLSFVGFDAMAAPFVLPYLLTFPASLLMVSALLRITFFQWLRAVGYPIGAAAIMGLLVALMSSQVSTTSPTIALVELAATGVAIYGALAGVLFRSAMIRQWGIVRLRYSLRRLQRM